MILNAVSGPPTLYHCISTMILLTEKSAFKTTQLKDSIGTIKEQAVLTREHHGMLIYSVVAHNISIQDTITPRKVVRAIPP